MKNNAQLVQPEIALQLDASGVIRKAAFSNDIANEGLVSLVGQRWADTVRGSGGQVHRMMLDAQEKGVSRIQRLQQRFPSGVEVSVEYTAVTLGPDEGFVAIGRNLEVVKGMLLRVMSTQAEMARDSWKLHDVVTRHRLLQDASSEPMLIVDAESLVVEQANPAAQHAIGVQSDVEFLPKIAETQRAEFRAALERVRADGEAPEIVMNLGVDGRQWHARAALLQAERGARFVLRLSPAHPRAADDAPDTSPMRRLRDPVVVVDCTEAIVGANRAFVELVQKDDQASLIGAPLRRWLSLSTNVTDSAGGPSGSAVVRGELGGESTVEVHTANALDMRCLVLRRVEAGGTQDPWQSMDRRVEEGVCAVERRCFVTALEMAKDDRHAVERIFGLDTQSSGVCAGS